MARNTPEQRARWTRTYNEQGGYAKIHALNKATKERNRAYVQGLKSAGLCTDCRADLPHYVMQYDHIGDDKEAAVARLVSGCSSIARIDAEIAKCELVCANCHAIRTWNRMHP